LKKLRYSPPLPSTAGFPESGDSFRPRGPDFTLFLLLSALRIRTLRGVPVLLCFRPCPSPHGRRRGADFESFVSRIIGPVPLFYSRFPPVFHTRSAALFRMAPLGGFRCTRPGPYTLFWKASCRL